MQDEAEVDGQLVKWSFPTPEVHCSHPVIAKLYVTYLLYWKDENKRKKWPGMAHLNKTKNCCSSDINKAAKYKQNKQ